MNIHHYIDSTSDTTIHTFTCIFIITEIGDPKKNVWTRFNDAMMTLVKYTGHKVGRGLRSSMDRVGGQIERRINNSNPNTAYALKVMLICPTLFICHFWFLLAPYSEYTLLDIPLFVVRHGGE